MLGSCLFERGRMAGISRREERSARFINNKLDDLKLRVLPIRIFVQHDSSV